MSGPSENWNKKSRLEKQYIGALAEWVMFSPTSPKPERPGVSLDEAARLRRLWHRSAKHDCCRFDRIYETDDYVCIECGQEFSEADHRDLEDRRARQMRGSAFMREWMGEGLSPPWEAIFLWGSALILPAMLLWLLLSR